MRRWATYCGDSLDDATAAAWWGGERPKHRAGARRSGVRGRATGSDYYLAGGQWSGGGDGRTTTCRRRLEIISSRDREYGSLDHSFNKSVNKPHALCNLFII